MSLAKLNLVQAGLLVYQAGQRNQLFFINLALPFP